MKNSSTPFVYVCLICTHSTKLRSKVYKTSNMSSKGNGTSKPNHTSKTIPEPGSQVGQLKPGPSKSPV